MKDTSQPPQKAEHDSPSQVSQSTSSPSLPPSANAHLSHIRQAAYESSAPVNLDRPLFLRENSETTDSATPQHNRVPSTDSAMVDLGSAIGNKDPQRQDEPPATTCDSSVLKSSGQSDGGTPLKVRRRGMINDKKLTINTTTSSSFSSNSIRRASDTRASTAPTRPERALRKSSDRSVELASSSPGSKGKESPATSPLAPPASASIRRASLSPTECSPLAENKCSPCVPSGSLSSASAGASSGSSDKPLLSDPSFSFNPKFQLGQKNGISSPRPVKNKTSPTKPSPTYISPRTSIAPNSSHSNEASSMSQTPRSPRIPTTPRIPRTPLTARLPYASGLGPQSAASYQGGLLTTITRAASGERVVTQTPSAGSGTASVAVAANWTRNRNASIATEIKEFMRGGASEVIPRLELRVLERPDQQSGFFSFDPEKVQLEPEKRHSLAAAQPSILKEKPEIALQDQTDDSSPRASAFARSLALEKLKNKRVSRSTSIGRRGSTTRHSGNFDGLSYVGKDSSRRERRRTGASVVSGHSRRSDRSAKSNRSGLIRRTSTPMIGAGSIESTRPSFVDRRLSLAPSYLRGPLDETMQLDSEESENEDDLVHELHSRVTNIHEAKRWILSHHNLNNINVSATSRDVQDEQRSISAMRRPTYAASVFQQARLMEAERQAVVAPASSSALDVYASAANMPFTPFPQTPGFPKTPHTAFPGGTVEEGKEPLARPDTAAAVLPEPTWKQTTAHYLTAPWRFVQRQISPKYVLTMVDPREILFPITLRKIALWFIYGGIIAMLVLLDRYYHWWAKLDHVVHGQNLAIMGVLYGFEPTMIVIIMLVARVPDARIVPDRTVLVPHGRERIHNLSDEEESKHSTSSDEESVADADMATQMHSTILEEEHDEDGGAQPESQGQETSIVDRKSRRSSGGFPDLQQPPMHRASIYHAPASGRSDERRGSEAAHNSGALQVPRTPGFDPRNRRSTIILREPLIIDSVNVDLQALGERRPSTASHQLVLARTASRDSRRNSYFSMVAAAAGARPGGATLGAEAAAVSDLYIKKDGKDLIANHSDSSAGLDEKKAVDVIDSDKPDDVRIAMDSITHPSMTESTALVIPCHNSDVEVLKAVLFAALVHFDPWQIFVVDNGNSPQPPTDMESSIRSQPMFARVNYIWLPVGNKNIAQFVGAKAAAVLNLDYVLTIDDDVIIPANFAAPMHIISEIVTAVCYPITAVDHKGDRPLFVGWQDLEYKMSALAKMAESRMCGVLFPHGAASFWKRETMIAVLRRHDLIYFADDVKMGLELQAIGQRMGIDASISFETVAPETFLGPPTAGTPNYYNQRVRSWEMARHTLYWQFSKRFLFSLNGARTPVAIGWQKFAQFYNSTTNFIDWIRLPMFILLGASGQFWLRSFAFIVFLPVVPLLPYRFIKTRNRPDLHPHLIDMLTYGIYKLMYSVVCVFGGIRSMLVFFPNHGHKPNLVEMEKKQDPRCIWLRDDFMKNSGGQGDLRDEPQQIMLDDAAAAVAAATVVQMAKEQHEVAEAGRVNALPSIAATSDATVAV